MNARPGPAESRALARCLAGGGLALFPTDTVYGLCCDPRSADAVARLYALKGRAPDQPAAVLFFTLEHALRELSELGPRTREALRALLPGALTLLLANPRARYPLAGGGLLGVRVIDVGLDPGMEVLQSSANRSGAPDARALADVEESIRAGVDLVIDGGRLAGKPSTVVDLEQFELTGDWTIRREGAVSPAAVGLALEALVGSRER